MLKNVRVLMRLAAMVAVLLVLMATIALIGMRGMSTVQEGLRTVYEDRVVPLEQISMIQSAYFKVRIAVMDAAAANDVAVVQKDTATIAQEVGAAGKLWQAYLALYLTPEEKELAATPQTSLDAYDAVRGRVLAALGGGDFAGGKALARSEGAPALAKLMEDLAKLEQLQVDVAKSEYGKAGAAYQSDRLQLIGGLAVAVLLGSAIAWIIGRSITVPLRRITGVMQALTAGDLAVTVAGTERKDEV